MRGSRPAPGTEDARDLRVLEERGPEYENPDGTKGVLQPTTTRPAPSRRGQVYLTPAVLVRHFRARGPADVVGLHTTSPEDTSLWGTVEIDWHGLGSTPPAANEAASHLPRSHAARGRRPAPPCLS